MKPLGALVVSVVLLSFAAPSSPEVRAAADSRHSSAWWLGAIPEGEAKRKFILDCTGCHQLDESHALFNGAARSRQKWSEDITRMLGFAGASTGFPVIAADRHAEQTASWLSNTLSAPDGARPEPIVAVRQLADSAGVRITEYNMPEPADLPHDVAVDSTGLVVITGMFSHTMYTLDPQTGRLTPTPLPMQQGGPRAIEIDGAGNWWVLLAAGRSVARYEPMRLKWTTWPIDMYPHSIGVANDGRLWYNGHFTRAPELIAALDPRSGATTKHELPAHSALRDAGGPVPYELRIAPDGRVWMSELQGNRMVVFDPKTNASKTYEMPTTWSGPRRFDIGADGILWIPLYAANQLVRLDPRTDRLTVFDIPLKDAVPYVVRVDHGSQQLWIGTSAGDALLRFDIARETWKIYPLPSRGALVRHMAIDPRTHDVWLAYGASPSAIPAKVARVQVLR
jgi:virginiamycin B lyase